MSENAIDRVTEHPKSVCTIRRLHLTRRLVSTHLRSLRRAHRDRSILGRVSDVRSPPRGTVSEQLAVHWPRARIVHQGHERTDRPWAPIQNDEDCHSEQHHRHRWSRYLLSTRARTLSSHEPHIKIIVGSESRGDPVSAGS